MGCEGLGLSVRTEMKRGCREATEIGRERGGQGHGRKHWGRGLVGASKG